MESVFLFPAFNQNGRLLHSLTKRIFIENQLWVKCCSRNREYSSEPSQTRFQLSQSICDSVVHVIYKKRDSNIIVSNNKYKE